MNPQHYCRAEGVTDLFRIISIDDTSKILPLLSSALMSEEESLYMRIRSHYVVEMSPPLVNVAADHRGGSRSIQAFIATVAP